MVLANVHQADKTMINLAIENAMEQRKSWDRLPYEHRCGGLVVTVDMPNSTACATARPSSSRRRT